MLLSHTIAYNWCALDHDGNSWSSPKLHFVRSHGMPIDISKVDSSGFKIVGACGRHANESSFCGDRGGVFNTQKHEPIESMPIKTIFQAQCRSMMLGEKIRGQ